MKTQVKVLVLSIESNDLHTKIASHINRDNDHYIVELVENPKHLMLELNEYRRTNSLNKVSLDEINPLVNEPNEVQTRRIVLVDSRRTYPENKKGIDIVREIQAQHPDVEIVLIIQENSPTPELNRGDTYRLFKYPFEIETLTTNIRLASRKNRKTLRRRNALESITDVSQFIVRSDNRDEIITDVVKLAPQIASWSLPAGSLPFCHFAILEQYNGSRVLRFYEKHHNIEVWKKLKDRTEGGMIVLNDADTDKIPEPNHTSEKERKKIGIIGLAATQRKAFNVGNVLNEEYKDYYINLDPDVRSQLAVPIILRTPEGEDGEVYGVINLEHTLEYAFDDSDKEALEILANHIAIAYKNAVHAEERKRQADALEVLHDMAVYLNENPRDLTANSIIARTVKDAKKLLNISGDNRDYFTNFGLYRPEDDCLIFDKKHNSDAALEIIRESFPEGEVTIDLNDLAGRIGIVGLVVKNRKTICTGYAPEEYKDVYISVGNVISQLSVPIIVEDQVIGVLSAQHEEKDAFNQYDRNNLETLVNLVAKGIENLNDYRRSENSVSVFRAVHEADQLIHGARTEDETLRTITEQALTILNRDTSSMWQGLDQRASQIRNFAHIRLYDEGNGTITLEAVSPESMRIIFQRLDKITINLNRKDERHGITGRTVLLNETQKVLDVEQDPDYIPILGTTKAQLSIPLREREHRVIGVLSIETDDLTVLNSDNIEALKMIANVASGAIRSAKLLAETEKELEHHLGSLKLDHKEARKRARLSYYVGLTVAIISFVVLVLLILGPALTSLIASQPVNIAAAVIIEVVTILFLSQTDKANHRLDELYNGRVAKIRQFKMLLDECRRLPSPHREQMIKEIISDHKKILQSKEIMLPGGIGQN